MMAGWRCWWRVVMVLVVLATAATTSTLPDAADYTVQQEAEPSDAASKTDQGQEEMPRMVATLPEEDAQDDPQQQLPEKAKERKEGIQEDPDYQTLLRENEELRQKLGVMAEAERNFLGEKLLHNRRDAETSPPAQLRLKETGVGHAGMAGELGHSGQAGELGQTEYSPSIRAADCADHLVAGATKDGVYDIYPFTCLCSKPVKVLCDMTTDGGGWTVILNRQKDGFQELFNRTWAEYKEGFGSATDEYWIGNELLNQMTTSRDYRLRLSVNLNEVYDLYGLWSSFSIKDEVNRYSWELGSYMTESTTASNCLYYYRNSYFSTYDRDHDSVSSTNCAQHRQAPWWYYNSCSNPAMIPTSPFGQGGSLKSTCYNKVSVEPTGMQLKIRPSICSSSMKTIYLNSYQCGVC